MTSPRTSANSKRWTRLSQTLSTKPKEGQQPYGDAIFKGHPRIYCRKPDILRNRIFSGRKWCIAYSGTAFNNVDSRTGDSAESEGILYYSNKRQENLKRQTDGVRSDEIAWSSDTTSILLTTSGRLMSMGCTSVYCANSVTARSTYRPFSCFCWRVLNVVERYYIHV